MLNLRFFFQKTIKNERVDPAGKDVAFTLCKVIYGSAA